MAASIGSGGSITDDGAFWASVPGGAPEVPCTPRETDRVRVVAPGSMHEGALGTVTLATRGRSIVVVRIDGVGAGRAFFVSELEVVAAEMRSAA